MGVCSVTGTCMFLTSKFRSVRTLTPISVLHHNKVSMGAIDVGTASVITSTRNIRIGTSVVFTSTSFDSTSLLVLPNKVPNTGGLSRRRNIHTTLIHRTRRRGLVNTVYTTPVILNRLKLLHNGHTAYCPNFRARLSNTACATRPYATSNGVVANGNPNTSFTCTCQLLRRFGNTNIIRRLGGKVVCRF